VEVGDEGSNVPVRGMKFKFNLFERTILLKHSSDALNLKDSLEQLSFE
jgi:hypothetical protein